MDFLFPYSEKKVKPYLQMSVQRIKLSTNKMSTAAKIQKKEISKLLSEGKTEMAIIKVEHIIREDFSIEGYGVIELMLELVNERIRQISSNKDCPVDMVEAVSSLIWAATNVDIAELGQVKAQFAKKFGKEFVMNAENNVGGVVNVRMLDKLVYRPPSAQLVACYLDEIARVYNVDWSSEEYGLLEKFDKDKPIRLPIGSSIRMAHGSGLNAAYSSNEEKGSAGGDSGSSPTPSQASAPAVAQRELDSHEVAEYEEFKRNQTGAPYVASNQGRSQLSAVPNPYPTNTQQQSQQHQQYQQIFLQQQQQQPPGDLHRQYEQQQQHQQMGPKSGYEVSYGAPAASASAAQLQQVPVVVQAEYIPDDVDAYLQSLESPAPSGKSFDASGSISPVIAAVSNQPNPNELTDGDTGNSKMSGFDNSDESDADCGKDFPPPAPSPTSAAKKGSDGAGNTNQNNSGGGDALQSLEARLAALKNLR